MDKPKEIDYCEAKEGSEFWNKGSKWMKWACKEKLCQLATTGEWKAGRFKQYKQWRARKMPWKATMPGHKSIGYEDAYKKFCVRTFGTAYGGKMLGDFDDLDQVYGMKTTSGTFNKKVCHCRGEDDCS